MCRIPKVIIVAPQERQLELRRALSSLEYEIVAAVSTGADAADISADVAVVVDPDAATITALRERGLKTVSVGAGDEGADMTLGPDDASQFKTRVWELFRPA
jgi:hypothetical protein